jgi:hypothetical protein
MERSKKIQKHRKRRTLKRVRHASKNPFKIIKGGNSNPRIFNFYCDTRTGDNILNLKFFYNISHILKEKNIKINYYYESRHITSLDELERYVNKDVVHLDNIAKKPNDSIQLWMGNDINSIHYSAFDKYYDAFYKNILNVLGLNNIDTSLFQKEDYLLDIYNKLDPKFKNVDILIVNAEPQSGQFIYDKNAMDTLCKNLALKYKVVTTTKVNDSTIPCTIEDGLKIQDIGAISTHANYVIAVFSGPITSMFNTHTKNHVKKWFILDKTPFSLGVNTVHIHSIAELNKLDLSSYKYT